MSAYCIFILHELYDRAALEAYWAAVRPTLAGYPAKMLSGYRPFDLLEGDTKVEATAVVEFESMEQARAWYHSPEYQAVKPLRADAGRFTGLLVDGGITPNAERRLREVPRP